MGGVWGVIGGQSVTDIMEQAKGRNGSNGNLKKENITLIKKKKIPTGTVDKESSR